MQKGQVIKATDFLGAIDDKIIGKVDTTLTLTAGTGLSGGGNLTANRTFNFDTTWGDNRYTVSSRTISTGDGLTGGGNLTANRTLTVDSTVVRTSRNLTAGTGISGGGNLSADRTFSFDTTWGDARYSLSSHNHNSLYALLTTSISAGTGLTGGGTIAANRTISFDTTWGDARYASSGVTITVGTGLTGGGNLTANRTLAFDTTWGDARYQLHNITQNDGFAILVSNGDANTLTNTGWYRGVTVTNAPTSDWYYFEVISHTSSWVVQFATRLHANIKFMRRRDNGTWQTWVRIDGGDKADSSVTISTGTGITGGGNLTANRTLSFDTTWGDARYALRTVTVSVGTGLTGGGNLTANRTISFDTTWGDARYVRSGGTSMQIFVLPTAPTGASSGDLWIW